MYVGLGEDKGVLFYEPLCLLILRPPPFRTYTYVATIVKHDIGVPFTSNSIEISLIHSQSASSTYIIICVSDSSQIHLYA